MTSSLELVSEQFPHLGERVACLFERHEVFRELCEDYEECRGTIARLETSGAGVDALRQEYAALRLRLETELLRYLVDAEDPTGQK